MPVLSMPSVSTQPVQQQVLATVGGAAYNPSGDTVQMSFVAVPTYGPPPNPTVWNAATWEVDPGPVYFASCLIGPANGGIVLAAGVYQIYVRIIDQPAVPVLAGWQLQIV